jgi:hypothetical protein
MASQGLAYSSVFGFETVMFVMSAACAIWVGRYDKGGVQKVEVRHVEPIHAMKKELSHEY